MPKIRNESLEQFFKELKFAPVKQQQKQLEASVDLLKIIEDDMEYPFEFVCFRITDYRMREDMSGVLIMGDQLADDLRTYIDRLSTKLMIPAAQQDEKIHSVDELCKKFSVSRKTIQRWRKRGLIGWMYVFPDGRRGIGFKNSAVEEYIENNRLSADKAKKFSKLTIEQKAEIIDLARKYVSQGQLSRYQVIIKIANGTNRSREAIRYMLIDYEKQHPQDELFSKPSGTISPKEASQIYKMRKSGASLAELMEKFNRSRSSIHRIINQRRAKFLLGRKIDLITSQEFDKENAEKMILGDTKLIDRLQSTDDHPLLTRTEEVDLFRRYNYLKFLALQMLENINHVSPSGRRLKKIETLLTTSEKVKNLIVEANLGLVVSIAKRHTLMGHTLPDLISEGNMMLMHAVDKFDYSRGYRFSTYASLAIAKEYARKDPDIDRVAMDQSTDMANIEQDMRNISQVDVVAVERAHQSLDEVITNNLTEREQYVIRNHFGLDGNRITNRKMTLNDIGQKLGLTKERVRQIELIALQQLRHCLSPEEFDLLTG